MKKYKLGELITIKHGFAFKSEKYVDNSKYRLVTLGNFDNSNNFKYNNAKATYYESDFPSEYILNAGDLIMPLTEQVIGLFGNSAFVPEVKQYEFVLNQRVGKVIPDENKIDKYYLHYLLATNIVREQIEARASGTKQRNISPENIYDVEVFIPNIDIQNKIGRFLYNLETKINNNNKIILELEQISKTIYDYWFLQYEFPNEEGKPYKSSGGKMVWNEELKREIPEGWIIYKGKDLFDFVKGKNPKQIFKTDNNIDKIKYLNIESLNQNKNVFCNKENMILANREVLMVMDGASSSEVYIGSYGAIGSTLSKLKIKNRIITNNFLYVMMKKYEKVFKKVNIGSTIPHANKNYINAFKIALPPNRNLQDNITSLIDEIIHNREENEELTKLKNYLLPLLMNGQVGFKETSK